MKNKKGFTLIELLAVIVILAIIALIVTPVVSNIITSSRNSANARSVEGHIDNIEYGIMTKAFNEGKDIRYLDKTITTDGTINDRNTKFGFDFPNNDNIVCEKYAISNGLVIGATGCKESSWKLTYSYTSTGGAVSGDIEVPTTYASYAVGDAINFDVTNGTKCTSPVSTTGTKEGCMKFYVIEASSSTSDKVTMILDHNTTSSVVWNSDETTYAGPKEVLESLKNDTLSWNKTVLPVNYSYTLTDAVEGSNTYTINYSEYKARLITKEEATKIISYNWSYENMASSYGYWTSDGDGRERAWAIANDGTMNVTAGAHYQWFGVRPVITVLKSDLQ